jgi:hypothetical protein
MVSPHRVRGASECGPTISDQLKGSGGTLWKPSTEVLLTSAVLIPMTIYAHPEMTGSVSRALIWVRLTDTNYTGLLPHFWPDRPAGLDGPFIRDPRSSRMLGLNL